MLGDLRSTHLRDLKGLCAPFNPNKLDSIFTDQPFEDGSKAITSQDPPDKCLVYEPMTIKDLANLIIVCPCVSHSACVCVVTMREPL